MRWRDALSAALDDITGGAHSALELRYVSRVERPHRLPRPQRQVRVVRGLRTEYRDALYTEFGVGVETDGAARTRRRPAGATSTAITPLRPTGSPPCATTGPT